ncbi:hypothetical protein D3C85_1874570 [compost metagenome]
MVRELIVPPQLAGVDVKGDGAGAELLRFGGAIAPPLIRHLVAQRQVNHAQLLVDAGQ